MCAACVENIDYRAERGLSKSVIRALAQDSSGTSGRQSAATAEAAQPHRCSGD
jgi:hypothetical protein